MKRFSPLVVFSSFVLFAFCARSTEGWAESSETMRSGIEEAAVIPASFYRIRIVDGETSRGIPMVRVSLVNGTDYFADSAGVIALQEPDLWNCDVELKLETYGYSYPKNWFNDQTVHITPVPGGNTTIAMKRENIAHRLYRTTGSGIYRDSILLGDKTPPTQDTAAMHIMGCDGSQMAEYRGKLLWIRGDTGISATGLGNFKSTGAFSELPGKGGLDPEVGIEMKYLRTENGRPKPMINTDHKGPVWMGGMRVVRDKSGKERLFADYMKVEGGLPKEEKGLLEYDDEKEQFEILFPYKDSLIQVEGVPCKVKENGQDYFYFTPSAAPNLRCPANVDSIKDINSYEAFTCLKEGTSAANGAVQLDRDGDGKLQWGWKRNTSPVTAKLMAELLKSGKVRPEEAWFRLTDVNTGKEVLAHSGSVHWNPWRQRWVSIQEEQFGTSWLGEVWFFEADTPLGPWVYGQKIATHSLVDEKSEAGKRMDEVMAEQKKKDNRSFYCVCHHPELDKDGGRVIFFEGTLSMSFSDAAAPIPRYDYNELLYKLELDDPRLALPVAVYRVKDGKDMDYRSKQDLGKAKVDEVAFFAPDRACQGTMPVYRARDEKGNACLSMEKKGEDARIAFYAVEADADIASTSSLSQTVALNEFVQEKSGKRIYSTDEGVKEKGFEKRGVVCRVWPRLIAFNPFEIE